MIKLSVILPVYNVEDYLAKCLDSVILADEPDYEIILVNDGSTDSSPAIAASYREQYPDLIRLISTENMGLGSARNTGMANARGEFYYFLDSDDYLAPGAMRSMLDIFDRDFDICIFDSISVDPAGHELQTVKGCTRETGISLAEYPELLLQIPNVWNKIYRASLFRDNGILFTPREWFEDLRTVLKLYAFTDKILYISEAWHRYLIRPGSITNSAKAERNREIITAVDDLREFYREMGRFDALKNELDYLTFHAQFLTSSVRANLADPNSPVQELLLTDFLKKCPDFQENPYVKQIPPKYRLLTWLLLHRRRRAVNLVMRLNKKFKYHT